jgi:hypothetical protein
VIGNGEEKNSINFQRRGLYLSAEEASVAGFDFMRPEELERVDVRSVDLIERAEAPAGVVSVVSRPGIGRRLTELGRIQILGG